MIYGHIHANTNAEYWLLIEHSDLMLNAGADVNNYAPVTFDEMVQNNMEHRAKVAARRMVENNRELFARAAELQNIVEKMGGEIDVDGDD